MLIPGAARGVATVSLVIDLYQFSHAVSTHDATDVADELSDLTGDWFTLDYGAAIGTVASDVVRDYVADGLARWIVTINT